MRIREILFTLLALFPALLFGQAEQIFIGDTLTAPARYVFVYDNDTLWVKGAAGWSAIGGGGGNNISTEKVTQNITANTPTNFTFATLTEYYSILVEDSNGTTIIPSVRRLSLNSVEVTVAVTDDYTIRVTGI